MRKRVKAEVILKEDESGDIFMQLGPNDSINLTWMATNGRRKSNGIIARNILAWADLMLSMNPHEPDSLDR